MSKKLVNRFRDKDYFVKALIRRTLISNNGYNGEERVDYIFKKITNGSPAANLNDPEVVQRIFWACMPINARAEN